MSTAHWRSGWWDLPTSKGSEVEAACFVSIEDAAQFVLGDMADRLKHAYDEWDLGIDGAGAVYHAAKDMRDGEERFTQLEDAEENPDIWLALGQDRQVHTWWVRACNGGEHGTCNVQPEQEH